jgi:photosystem II stability/assembly factor-like uncharacterized protein
MVARERRLVLACVLALVLGGITGTPSAWSDEQPPTGEAAPWQALGPCGVLVVAIAVSPNWLSDRTLLAARAGPRDSRSDLVRSRDGGRTWERLPGPENPEFVTRSIGIPFFGFAPGERDARTLFLLSDEPGISGRSILYRSEDTGEHWRRVLDTEWGGRLVLSPDFESDRTALMVGGGALYHSTDRGMTWQTNPQADRYVLDAAFSPDFRLDRTIFLSTGYDGGRASAATGAVLLSVDGGETWAVSTDGLDVEPHRYGTVESLRVSPTFSVDSTAYVVSTSFDPATCPPRGYRCPRDSQLFRSSDRGATWESVLSLAEPDRSAQVRYGRDVALSAGYATDGYALFTTVHLSGNGGVAGCTIYRTQDGGNTWSQAQFVYASIVGGGACDRMHLIGGSNGLAMVNSALPHQ